jgi:hypothetical protein
MGELIVFKKSADPPILVYYVIVAEFMKEEC